MRKDMFRVIVERPRLGGVYGSKGRQKDFIQNNLDDSPTREKIRPVGKGSSRKSLNENLAPLVRFLGSRVGKHWDEVYSEVREHLSANSAVQKHVVDHLKQYVVTDAFILNGTVGYYPKYYKRDFVSLEEPGYFKRLFYVHPETGLLCKTPYKSRRTRKEPVTKHVIDAFHQFRLFDNVWHMVTLEEIPKELGKKVGVLHYRQHRSCNLIGEYLDFGIVKDVLFPNGSSSRERAAEYGYADIYAIEKRPCGKRELKKINKIITECK